MTDASMEVLLPDLPPTRQVWWSLVLSRLTLIQFLIDLGGEPGKRMNKDKLAKLRVTLKRMQRDGVFESVLAGDLRFEVLEQIKTLMSS